MTDFTDDYGVGGTGIDKEGNPTILQAEEAKLVAEVKALKAKYRTTRFATYKARQNFLKRIRTTEQEQQLIKLQLVALQKNTKYQLYRAQENKRKSGLSVVVSISVDGLAYSNPAPKILNSQHIWVRAEINDVHVGQVGLSKTHELVHLTWSYYSRFTHLDTIPATGHDEYFVSYPLVIIREFNAPSSGSTAHNFLVYADAYEEAGNGF